ncbi:hypothetical protein J2X60_000964 [Curtobacterium sp. 320]|uniref:hypothetical protein n=1 Tax=Curtobacterium sp. 320 TaxID=2817749 RepID=UPI0028660C02|nr:hypothetical protein [Curtobacterium sp. 320]MDR6572328.1 hypothetical protein [Curtobacterium sp. 320]
MPDTHWRLTHGNQTWELNFVHGEYLRKILDDETEQPAVFKFPPRDDAPVSEVRIVLPTTAGLVLERLEY